MAEKDTITKQKIKYNGLGDFKAAYSFAHDWLKDRGFGVTEDEYSEKITGDSKEISFKWSASKKVSDYFKVSLSIGWRIDGMKDVEVEIDGKKKNMNKFNLSIDIKGVLEKDTSGSWSGKPTHKFLKDLYHKFIIPERISQREDEVESAVDDFKEEMKAFFELTGRK